MQGRPNNFLPRGNGTQGRAERPEPPARVNKLMEIVQKIEQLKKLKAALEYRQKEKDHDREGMRQLWKDKY
jgi:hypothetical protein